MANQPYSEYYLKDLVVENTSSLNVRSGPGSTYAVIDKLNDGDRMTFLAMAKGWVKVKLESTGRIGFVYSEYVAVL